MDKFKDNRARGGKFRAAMTAKPTILLFFLLLPLALAAADDRRVADAIGVCHVGGKYHFTDKPFLVEGGDVVRQLGSRAIKVWLTPDDHDLVKLVQTAPYTQLFSMPLKVYALEALRYSYLDFRKITDQDLKDEEEGMYQLAKFLLEKYAGTGKTFILQNWEGDYYLRSSMDLGGSISPETFENMVKWFNARQNGVDRARKEKLHKDVNVYHAAEANAVVTNMNGQPCVVNNVVPKTRCDLYSYSAYESQYDPRALIAALRYFRKAAPDSAAFGDYNVYIGEFGWAENKTPGAEIAKKIEDVVAVVVRERVPFAFYWQLYCNEWATQETPNPANKDMKGFWLVRPDRGITPMYETLQALMQEPLKDGSRFKYGFEKDTGKPPLIVHQTPRLDAVPALDGDPSDWKDKALKISVSDKARVFEMQDWSAEKCSGEFYVAYTREGLLIGASVSDDKHMQDEKQGAIWKQDGIQVSIDPGNEKNPFYDANDQELGFALTTDGKTAVAWRWHGASNELPPTIRCAALRKDGHTFYEIFIPFTELKTETLLGPGGQIGINFVINDDDGRGRGWIEMEDGIARTKNPSLYPTFILAR